jgi:hypothetical protein
MGEARAIGGTDFINAAFIILEIEKLAGLYFIDPIAIVSFQPLLAEFFGCLVEMRGNAFDICIGKRRRHCFATIGAGEAGHFFPYFFFQAGGEFFQTAWWFFFQLAEKTAHSIFAVTRFLLKGTETEPGFTHGSKIARFGIRDAGCGMRDTGYEIRDTGCGMRDVGTAVTSCRGTRHLVNLLQRKSATLKAISSKVPRSSA